MTVFMSINTCVKYLTAIHQFKYKFGVQLLHTFKYMLEILFYSNLISKIYA